MNVVVLAAVFGGYALAGGKFAVIVKAAPIELFIIGGALPALYISYLAIRYASKKTTRELPPESTLFAEIDLPAEEAAPA